MRLRIRVERNGLPPVSILWPVSESDNRLTVGQLLHLIDEKIPLEGDTWGLEDYAVLTGGYEALHYNELGNVFKDEDEVVVRALQWRDRKIRLLAGRDQISADGRHLVDGVPFGRPLITRAIRPDIRIPPLKKQKLNPKIHGVPDNMLVLRGDLSDEEEATEDEEDNSSNSDAIGSESEDGIFEPGPEPGSGSDVSSDSEGVDSSDIDSDDSDSVSSESDSDSGSSTSGSSSDSEGSSVRFELSESKHTTLQYSPRQQRATMTGNLRERAPVNHNTMESHETISAAGMPFRGKETTQSRNLRRRESKKLKFLKAQGTLPPEASFESLHNWERENESQKPQAMQGNTKEQDAIDAARQRLLQSLATDGGIDVTPVSRTVQTEAADSEADSPPEEFPFTDPPAQPSHNITKRVKSSRSVLEKEHFPTSENATHQIDSHQSRAPQVSAANRLIYGSLGVKTPKTQNEANALQSQLSQRSLRRTKKLDAITAAGKTHAQADYAEDEDDDSEAWRQKFTISAVECCDEDINLSAPPFPFRQRWDPQYQGKKNKRHDTAYTAPKKRRKGEFAQGYYVETYDKYNKLGGDALDYDDAEDPSDYNSSYWEEGALLEHNNIDENASAADQQLLSETAATDKDGDFPPLPLDSSTLPPLAEKDALEGDYILYHELTCSAATDWQPKMVAHTIRLEEKSDKGWAVTTAPRDLPPKEYDEEGRRVYAKFEMCGVSDDEDDEDDKIVNWDDLSDPRLLRRPGSGR